MLREKLMLDNTGLAEVLVAVVIPSYKVTSHITNIIEGIPDEVWRIYVVDDACPDGSGCLVEKEITDGRVQVIFNSENQGVGGAVMTGYREAMTDGADIVVKIDGDGQMDPRLIPLFTQPLINGEADYAKGNRFFDLEQIRVMPKSRIFGNGILSFLTKLSSGYWNIFDPTNGYTAIQVNVLKRLPLNKISQRYFFESDMLFRLNTIRAVVVDVPMDAKYGGEVSNLHISKIVTEFLFKHSRNIVKRIFYNYYLRDVSLASIELPLGLLMIMWGLGFGGFHWYISSHMGIPTPAGTVMLAAMPLLMGLQLVLAFLAYDIRSVPTRPMYRPRMNLKRDL
jgi:dolichol-phosphate mannosyltransferase